MQLHNLKPKTKRKTSAQVGRGGTRGKTSGRGTKGQNARAGRKKRPELRDIIKKLPKMRGRGKNSNLSIQTKPVVLNLDRIAKAFSAGDTVSPMTLVSKGVIKTYKGKYPKVKILSLGEEAKFVFEDCTISKATQTKIEKAGG